MADNNGITIDPRYLSYDKDDVQSLLDKVNNADAEPTEDSGNMISSGAVAAALAGYTPTEQLTKELAAKQDKMTEAPEQDVRDIVKNWSPDEDPEPEPSAEV